MGFFKSLGKFFLDIIKEVSKKVIVFSIIVILILLALNYILGINVLDIIR